MNKVILKNKKIGETPLDVIKKLKTENSQLSTKKLAYAGRLDPMAEGLLLILVGDECKKRKEYENLPKEYEFEILFGVSTDTYDLLGKIVKTSDYNKDYLPTKLQSVYQTFLGTSSQEYPAYSSPRVGGKPLYYWARAGKLDEIKIPSKEISIHSLDLIETRLIQKDKLEDQILSKLSIITGNFRQEDIKTIWQEYFEKTDLHEFTIARLKITCSSGTYVRSLANEIGIKIGIPALAYSIKRIRIGDFAL